MPFFPSLHRSDMQDQPWSVWRTAAFGAFIGTLAALFKAWAPLHLAERIEGHGFTALAAHVAVAAAGFALLCAAAAALRNFLARQLD